jgi:toxin ParE1/3/4
MRKLHLSPAAAEDLENILQYTFDTWGENQFVLYHNIFQETFNTILADTEGHLSKCRDELFPLSRSIRSGHHVVFFRLRKNNIEIIRILHERMDFLRHMDEEE